MTQLACQHLVSSIEPRRYSADRNAKRLSDLVIRETLNVLEQDRQSKLRRELTDRAAHRIGHLSSMIGIFLRIPGHHSPHLDLRAERNETPSLSVLIRARVGHNPIKPGRKLRTLVKLAYAGKQLEEDL